MRNSFPIALLSISAAAMLFLAGCKDNSTNPSTSDVTADEDAAETVAAALGEENGGAIDQVGDVSELATNAGTLSLSTANMLMKGTNVEGFTKRYDSVAHKWYGTLVRTRGSWFALYYSSVYRQYEWWFEKNGTPLKNYVVGTDTATTIYFNILLGKAYAFTPRWEHLVDSLTTSWVVTNANTPTLTLNGAVYRTATDTVTTRNAQRTLRNQLILAYSNITAARGNRSTISATASGTVTGTYTATVTFLKGSTYTERNIVRNINVTFSGGTAGIRINGKDFTGSLKNGTLN